MIDKTTFALLSLALAFYLYRAFTRTSRVNASPGRRPPEARELVTTPHGGKNPPLRSHAERK